ncbi:hypothetical protein VPDG_00059 [Vibrio phage henriette 12B8]|uniref:hypothetical protein n=1 Tax=Vibrio phage henriette 12B8 TaxID=573174 RepID=UPI0002C0E9B3|nr:hypothetical protein VPDG_00059 [Vibrio phage henriette 12B8]AGG58220.1 hypothetical protein VPDG_00059 [Vibrio phage henriette 12B8]
MNNQEQNKKTRELIAHISNVINDMDLDTTKPFVGYGERIIHKAISEASGVKRSMTHVTAGRGIVDSVDHNKYQYEDCAEYYFPLMYPNILIKEHGHLEFGNQTLGEFINILIVLRQESKRINDNYSVKCKCLLNALFGFICRSKLEWAGEVAICVPAKVNWNGREKLLFAFQPRDANWCVH